MWNAKKYYASCAIRDVLIVSLSLVGDNQCLVIVQQVLTQARKYRIKVVPPPEEGKKEVKKQVWCPQQYSL